MDMPLKDLIQSMIDCNKISTTFLGIKFKDYEDIMNEINKKD